MTNEPRDPVGSQDAARPDRRQLLGGAAAGALGASQVGASEAKTREDLFLPEEEWRERMTAPDDGKRYGWLVDTRRCFGCHGCEVACKAENDVPLGKFIRQTIYHDHAVETGSGVARLMIPMACQHCEDAPCIKACPCGSLHKGPGGSVQVNYATCSGHTACVDACPYGAIYIDPVANQAVKCHNCTHRVEEGLAPPCESTCPSEALYFGDLNDPESRVSKMAAKLEAENVPLETLREDKGTKPRMRFATKANAPLADWEHKVPGEGQSYATEAYDVYNWGEAGFDRPTEEDAR
ncbi:MAG: 4Fe-4S dicluster domain-containing protein [Planctomycetota bacterium]